MYIVVYHWIQKEHCVVYCVSKRKKTCPFLNAASTQSEMFSAANPNPKAPASPIPKLLLIGKCLSSSWDFWG